MSTPRVAPPRLNGRYVVVSALGKGAQARVYLAYDSRLELWRAVKVLAAAHLDDVHIRARFDGEAQMMARMTHRNLMRVVDVDSDGNIPYMVMDLARGGSIVDWMKRNGPMPSRMALGVVIECCHGLEYSHAQGIVHRDVKPHNILVHEDGRAILTDFGIARADDAVQMTANGAAMGTFAFMAPEQRADAHAVDERADVYALGATLYTMLSARTSTELFLADSRDKMLDGIADEIKPVLLTACKYEPELRYPTMADLRRALEEALAKLPPDRESPPLYQEMVPLTGGIPMLLEPEAGVDDLVRMLTPVEELATTLYNPGAPPSGPPVGGKVKTGTGKTDPGERSTVEELATVIPYRMPEMRRAPRSLPPEARRTGTTGVDPEEPDEVPDYIDADALAAAQRSLTPNLIGNDGRVVAPTPPAEPAKEAPKPAPATTSEPAPAAADAGSASEQGSETAAHGGSRSWLVQALLIGTAVLALAFVLGTAALSVSVKSSASERRVVATLELVTDVSQSEAVVEQLGQGGADIAALRAGWFQFHDAPPGKQLAPALEFASLAVREADRLGPRERSNPQVVELRKSLKEAQDAEAAWKASRSSALGRLTGSLGSY